MNLTMSLPETAYLREVLGSYLAEIHSEIVHEFENRQSMLDTLDSARDHIAGQIAAEQLAIIDEYIVGERFRTFTLAP